MLFFSLLVHSSPLLHCASVPNLCENFFSVSVESGCGLWHFLQLLVAEVLPDLFRLGGAVSIVFNNSLGIVEQKLKFAEFLYTIAFFAFMTARFNLHF